MESYGMKKRIDNLGRITVPSVFRDELGIALNDEVRICLVDDGILIRPIPQKNEDNK